MRYDDARAKKLRDSILASGEPDSAESIILDLLSDREKYVGLAEAAKLVSAEWDLVMAGGDDAHLTDESFDALDEALRALDEEE